MSLRADSRGAAMVVGLAFAVLLLSLVFYLAGLGEALLHRERVQDAADAAAFSAAVVNARGMNILALLNMTMAAVLAILVGLRLTETLCYAGIVLCGALAWPTAGASLSGVGPLTQAAKQIHEAAEKLKNPIKQALSVLHTAGAAVRVVVPVGANLRVIDQTVAHYDALGVAVPSRLTLPVEDDEFDVLCEHAGRYASAVAMLPISPVLPSSVEDAMGDVAGKIVAAGGSWFCGGEGQPPDFNGDARSRLEELPRFPSEEQCASYGPTRGGAHEVDLAEIERVCNRASVERLASTPDRLGRARDGETLCPSACRGRSDARCPPATIADCTAEESARFEAQRAELGGDAELAGDAPYRRRAELARSQCNPARAGLRGFWWTEVTRTRTYVYRRAQGRFEEEPERLEERDARFVQRDEDDRDYPCGPGGEVGEGYAASRDEPLCIGEAQCLEPGSGAGPCPRVPPGRGRPSTFRERTVEVTEVLRCVVERPLERVQTPPMDISDEMGDGKGKQQQPAKPFRLERDVYLGGSDFQLRSVVVGKLPNRFQGVVEMASWGAEPSPTSDVAGAAALLGSFAFGQAEYYFDFARVDGELDDETDEGDRTEWMWHMGWRARLRPFRLRLAQADAERRDKQGTSPQAGASAGGESLRVDEIDCAKLGAGAGCAQAERWLTEQAEAEEEP